MPTLRISVALCSCNGEKYILEQLDSIASQTRLPDELVISDDVSTDNTINVISDFARTVSFPVRLSVNELRLGSTKNFERTIKNCIGDIIVLADQDDVWMNNKLASIEDTFNKNPRADVVFSDAQLVDESLNSLGITQWQSVRFFTNEQAQMDSGNALHSLLHYNMVQGAAMAFRSQLQDRILPIPADVMHDAWIALITGIIGSIKTIREPLLMYRQHEHNQLGSNTESGIFGNATKIMRTDRARHIKTIRSTLSLYEHVIEHLLFIGADTLLFNLKPDVGKKVDHLRCRLHVAERSPGWLLLWARELILMRYRRYSVGFWSAGYDLVQGTLQP